MLLAAALTLSATPGLAYDLPSSYWSINDQYGAAVENNDNAGIIEFGTKIVDLISKEESAFFNCLLIDSSELELMSCSMTP